MENFYFVFETRKYTPSQIETYDFLFEKKIHTDDLYTGLEWSMAIGLNGSDIDLMTQALSHLIMCDDCQIQLPGLSYRVFATLITWNKNDDSNLESVYEINLIACLTFIQFYSNNVLWVITSVEE